MKMTEQERAGMAAWLEEWEGSLFQLGADQTPKQLALDIALALIDDIMENITIEVAVTDDFPGGDRAGNRAIRGLAKQVSVWPFGGDIDVPRECRIVIRRPIADCTLDPDDPYMWEGEEEEEQA